MIGREAELKQLKSLKNEEEPQFIAVYGRRRIGKTYLIRESFGYEFTFQHTGVGNDEKKILHHFICMGMVEGRRACAGFDVNMYMAYNPDVVEKLKYDTRQYYLHYIACGYNEGRRAI